jgi:hypothetical protein
VSERLAACVNILAPCRSTYRWQGAIESAQEVPLLIKTTAARYAALEAAIRAATPMNFPRSSRSQSLTACRIPGLGRGRNPCRTPDGNPPHVDPPAVPAAVRLAGMARAEEPLPPEQAFRFSAAPSTPRPSRRAGRSPTSTTCTATSSSSRLEGGTLGAPKLPPGKVKEDENFGKVETYRKEVKILLPVEAAGPVTLKAVSQGCWDGGICYPPINQEAQLDLAATGRVRRVAWPVRRRPASADSLRNGRRPAAPATKARASPACSRATTWRWCWPASSASACCCR